MKEKIVSWKLLEDFIFISSLTLNNLWYSSNVWYPLVNGIHFGVCDLDWAVIDPQRYIWFLRELARRVIEAIIESREMLAMKRSCQGRARIQVTIRWAPRSSTGNSCLLRARLEDVQRAQAAEVKSKRLHILIFRKIWEMNAAHLCAFHYMETWRSMYKY